MKLAVSSSVRVTGSVDVLSGWVNWVNLVRVCSARVSDSGYCWLW